MDVLVTMLLRETFQAAEIMLPMLLNNNVYERWEEKGNEDDF